MKKDPRHMTDHELEVAVQEECFGGEWSGAPISVAEDTDEVWSWLVDERAPVTVTVGEHGSTVVSCGDLATSLGVSVVTGWGWKRGLCEAAVGVARTMKEAQVS